MEKGVMKILNEKDSENALPKKAKLNKSLPKKEKDCKKSAGKKRSSKKKKA